MTAERLMQHRPPTRSWLCASAFTAHLADKARAVAADVAHFDLEDSVPADRKAAARLALQARFAARPEVATAIRINSLSTAEGLKDLLFLLDQEITPDILVLPKAVLPNDLSLAAGLLAERGIASVQLFAIIETVASLWALRGLTSAPPGLAGLIFGAADFRADLGVPPTVTDLRFVQQDIALAARRFGLAAIDSPCFQLDDPAALARELDDARALGFSGKIAIHPGQVAAINQRFTPSREAVDDARRLVAASDRDPSQPILRVDNQMVGPPFVKYARHVLAAAGSARRR
jgi:(S)-citramalyl-CoA lyase